MTDKPLREQSKEELVRLVERMKARFNDLAVEMEKHSNDHIYDEMPYGQWAAVEGVCADRIKTILFGGNSLAGSNLGQGAADAATTGPASPSGRRENVQVAPDLSPSESSALRELIAKWRKWADEIAVGTDIYDSAAAAKRVCAKELEAALLGKMGAP